MNEYNLNDFYTALREIILHQRASRECDRINSFSILTAKTDLGKDYLQGTVNDPYYFSRDSTQLLYPLFAVSQSFFTLGQYENDSYKRNCLVLEFGVIDQYHEPCSNCSPCEKRDMDTIKNDTNNLLTKMITEISTIRLYRLQPGDVLKYTVQGIVDQYIIDGVFTSGSLVNPESALLKKMWKAENQTKRSLPYTNKAMRLYGNFMIGTVCMMCNDSPIEYKLKKIENKNVC